MVVVVGKVHQQSAEEHPVAFAVAVDAVLGKFVVLVLKHQLNIRSVVVAAERPVMPRRMFVARVLRSSELIAALECSDSAVFLTSAL